MNWAHRSGGENPVFKVVKSPAGGEFLQEKNPPPISPPPVLSPAPRIEPMPHPPPGAIVIGGRAFQSRGSYADIMPVLKEFIPPGKGEGIIIHAGACRGVESEKLYVTWFREMICFEPDPRNLQQLQRRMHDLTQTHPFLIRVYPFAVGNRNGRVMLRQSMNKVTGEPWTESNTIKEIKDHHRQSPELDWSTLAEVGITRLDTFWQNRGCPNVHLFYSDVEGAEKEMLEGAQQMLTKTRFFFSEWSKSERYEGCLNADQTFKMLPGKWKVLAVFDHGHFGDLLAEQEF